MDVSLLFEIFSYAGTIAFAISGAIVAINRETDLFGVMILSFVTAFGGGITRDLLLDIGIPSFFTDYTGLIIACLVASLAVFFFAMLFKKNFVADEKLLDSINNYIDAVGIGAFSVSGVKIAFEFGYTSPLIAIFMGVLSCIGGGMIRDIMLNDVPFVLRKRVYAVACVAGASVYYLLWYFNVEDNTAMILGLLTTFSLRILATIFKWNIPKAIKFSELRAEAESESQEKSPEPAEAVKH